MPENPAHRIARIVRDARTYRGQKNESAYKVWANVLRVDEAPEHIDVIRIVSGRLSLLASQIDALRTLVETAGLPADDVFSQLEAAVSPRKLVANWNNTSPALDQVNLGMIETWAVILEDLDPVVSEEELAAVVRDLKGYRETTLSRELSPEVRDFILAQISVVFDAVENYRIEGIYAFADVGPELLKAAMRAGDAIVDEVEHDATFTNVLKKVFEWGSIVGTLRLGHEIVQKLLG